MCRHCHHLGVMICLSASLQQADRPTGAILSFCRTAASLLLVLVIAPLAVHTISSFHLSYNSFDMWICKSNKFLAPAIHCLRNSTFTWKATVQWLEVDSHFRHKMAKDMLPLASSRPTPKHVDCIRLPRIIYVVKVQIVAQWHVLHMAGHAIRRGVIHIFHLERSLLP